MTTTTTDLTPRQQEVYDFIDGYINVHSYGPTRREISHHLKINLNAVMGHLRALRRKGRITWEEHQSRTIRVVRGDA